MRATLATHELHNGRHRKVAWLSRSAKGISFDIGRFLMGSHTTYHVDGNVFRTSPATGSKAKPSGQYVPLAEFSGWYQLGVSMIEIDDIVNNSGLKGRDWKAGNFIDFLPLACADGPFVNLVLEFIDPSNMDWLNDPNVAPPPKSLEYRIDFQSVVAVITAITKQTDLLLWPTDDGFGVSHRNSRFSLNQKGVEYTFEAYE